MPLLKCLKTVPHYEKFCLVIQHTDPKVNYLSLVAPCQCVIRRQRKTFPGNSASHPEGENLSLGTSVTQSTPTFPELPACRHFKLTGT